MSAHDDTRRSSRTMDQSLRCLTCIPRRDITPLLSRSEGLQHMPFGTEPDDT